MDECVTLCFNKLEFPLPNHANLIEAGTVVFFRKSRKCKKKNNFQTDSGTDRRQTKMDQKSSLQISSQVS